jgi:hypothetical protein
MVKKKLTNKEKKNQIRKTIILEYSAWNTQSIYLFMFFKLAEQTEQQ